MSKKLIVILGMHRSGTSVVTRGLQTLGVELGDRLMPSVAGINDKGFWEDTDIVALNEEILHLLGSTWHSLVPLGLGATDGLQKSGYVQRATTMLRAKISSVSAFGLKDPRICKLLPFWKRVFTQCDVDVSYVLAIRNPVSVRNSLVKRDGFDSEKCYYIWLEHVLAGVTDPEVISSSVVVDYDRVLAQPKLELNRIAKAFSLTVNSSALDAYIDEFLEAGLRHSIHDENHLELDVACPPLVGDLYRSLSLAAQDALSINDDALQEMGRRGLAQIQEFAALFRLADNLDVRQIKLKEERVKLAREVDGLRHTSRERGVEIEHLTTVLRQRDAEILLQKEMTDERDQSLASLISTIKEIRESTSWRITSPMRSAVGTVRRAMATTRILSDGVAKQGGVGPTVKKTLSIVRQEGVAGLKGRVRVSAANLLAARGNVVAALERPVSSIAFRPYYLNPFYEVDAADLENIPTVAMHLHLFHEELMPQMLPYLKNIPCRFDLYVSISESADVDAVKNYLIQQLPKSSRVTVERVPNRGRDIAPFIAQFGRRLKEYKIVGHIHTKKSPHAAVLSNWLSDILDLLFGPKNSDGREVVQIINLLTAGAKVVYPEGSLSIPSDRTGWADNYVEAAKILRRYTDYNIEDFPAVEFPQGMMFWARTECISDFLALPLTFEDFPEEPIPADGTIAHALERIILLVTTRFEGDCIRLQRRDSTETYDYYEEQIDFSSTLEADAPKVLAYYLPQFHPTPENDEWHGKGFTEWTKVRAATPLFPGHYQQHIPHPDIGYYLLDSAATLAKQADMMKKAGVFGQIFYHYWFAGRLILEKPALMLLENPDIEMPYCFCWANENWTRRWDGNEKEILLGQDYSREDARAFIHYLIPFFKDKRYIRIDDRPILFVYRASSIPDPRLYIDMWAQECRQHGLLAPYVVAVLTRGATDPQDFDMDAGTERVLHDWTGGRVPDISASLGMYDAFNGSVLRYSDVANVYMKEVDSKPFTYFRSLVPVWDNTARYGSEAYVVHDCSPEKFQQWLELLIEQCPKNVAESKRLIIVNAWNEWAEGAHLEPDTLNGYAYLNSIGRALTGVDYSELRYAERESMAGVRLSITFSEFAKNALWAAPSVREQVFHCLANSTIFSLCRVEFSQKDIASEFASQNPSAIFVEPDGRDCDYSIVIGQLSYFPPDAIEYLARMGVVYKTSVIVSNSYGDVEDVLPIAANASVDRLSAYGAPFALYPQACQGEYKNFRLCPIARCFVTSSGMLSKDKLPVVTTILRVHRKADLTLLQNALLSLLAMRDCIVRPLIAAQDLTELQKDELVKLVNTYKWADNYPPIIRYFESADGNGDLRSTMLNESLKMVRTGYAAFLDYDDMLFPTAYSSLIHRLERTGKAVAFGRVYVAIYNTRLQRIVERRRTYEYGRSHADFVKDNHAPIHSFLLNMDKINVEDIVYFEDQKYMEDYLMTLQIFTEKNADWEALSVPNYVGDYIHSLDRHHTLAILDTENRSELLSNETYLKCHNRIVEIRKRKQR